MLKFSEPINQAFQQTQGDFGALTPESATWIMKLSISSKSPHMQNQSVIFTIAHLPCLGAAELL